VVIRGRKKPLSRPQSVRKRKNVQINKLGEFGLIEKIARISAVSDQQVVQAIGDDAAVDVVLQAHDSLPVVEVQCVCSWAAARFNAAA
jgi:hypothetical protein